MMNEFTRELVDAQRNRELVSFAREEIGSRDLQGYVVGMSVNLVLFHLIRDFEFNGFLLVERKHVSSVRCDRTNQFQHGLLVQSGVFERVDFDTHYAIDSWSSFLASQPKNSLAIVEEELCDPILVCYGAYIGVDSDNFIKMHGFSGAANWDEGLSLWEPEDITCIHVESPYLRPYSVYFETHTRSAPVGITNR